MAGSSAGHRPCVRRSFWRYHNNCDRYADGEKLARLETRVDPLELQVSEIRRDIRDLRTEMREEMGAVRAEHREDFQRLEVQL